MRANGFNRKRYERERYQRDKAKIQAQRKAHYGTVGNVLCIPAERIPKILQRLYTHVKVDGEHWVWTGALGGQEPWLTPWFFCEGKPRPAARVMWAIHKQVTVSPGERVSRTCDRPYCIAPHHLRIESVTIPKPGESSRDKRRRRILVEAKLAASKFMEWRKHKQIVEEVVT